MAESEEEAKLDISVVIPALNAENYLPALLRSIEGQTLRPREIVVVDSSPDTATVNLLAEWRGPVPIVFSRVDFAYPGHARNIGVSLARGEWIAFLDCRTSPAQDWLERSARIAGRTGAEFVGALCLIGADSPFTEVLRAATYGCGQVETMVGSLVTKTVFQKTGGFNPDVRAGEDSEWLHRIRTSGSSLSMADSPTIRYDGLVGSLPQAIAKWFKNNLAITDIEVKNSQKDIYLAVFIGVVFFVVFKWNATFAPGNDGGPYYLPNVTKIFVSTLFVLYVIYRGVVRPRQVGIKWTFLMPWGWLKISFVGLCLDLAKAPGLLWGAIVLLKRRLGRP